MKKWLLATLLVAAFQCWELVSGVFYHSAPLAAPAASKVVLYATNWCGYCRKARELLRSRGVAFVEHDIERSAEGRRQYDALRGRGVPLLVVNGTVIRGYSEQAILSALQR
jgi:glutaredoxin